MNWDAVICDFDDTLVASYAEFLIAEEEFLAALAGLGLPQGESPAEPGVRDWLRQADIANVERCGYLAPHCFPQALGQTYRHFAALAGREADPAVAAALEQIGWRVFDQQPRVLPEAGELLDWLQGRVRLFLLTQGDQAIQQRRILGSGLAGYFERIIILRKKTPAAYQQLAAELGLDPARCWMLGDSLKSDIAPALAVGLNAAYLKTDGWAYELALPAPGSYQTITSLSQFKELIQG